MGRQPLEVIKKLKEIETLISRDESKEALKILRRLKKKYPKNKTVVLKESGFLIDIAGISKNKKVLIEGIVKGKAALETKKFRKYKSTINYNIANGYHTLFTNKKYKRLSVILDNENLINAKKHFALALKEKPKDELKTSILTNYGNCLDHLGRSLEALYCYNQALEINPNHSMAKGNRAKTLIHFANISGALIEENYITAYQDIKSIINKPDLLAIGGNFANQQFKEELLRIERLCRDKDVLKTQIRCTSKQTNSSLTDFEKHYISFCKKHKLFLNFKVTECNCESALADSVFIRILTPINQDKKFYLLAKKINEIKEDFMISRILLTESLYKRKEYASISKRTTFVDTLDYANYGVFSGLLKNSFRVAYNTLDKIAFFINDYLKLKMNDNSIYFHSIWENRNRIKNKIKKTKNISLFAIYDLHLDFKNEPDYEKIKKIRNSITHRKLIIYDSLFFKQNKKEDYENIDYDTMLSNTIKLMKILKSAIIYLINFVENEENKKSKKIIGTVPFTYTKTIQ